jgi:hypothetical protein
MNMDIINSYRSVPSTTTSQYFDVMKFTKLLKSKEKIGWWRQFLNSVEEKRNEIQHDLQQYKSAKQN